jgi:hypothetical protein
VKAISCTGVAPGLAHVVAGDGDGVEARERLGAVAEGVRDDPQGGRRRVDVGPAGDVLLEHVVLDRAPELARVDALLLPDELVHQQQQGGRRVDRHRRRDLIERDPVEQRLHVLDRVDRDADLADLAVGDLGRAVVAHLRGQVEGHRQARGALLEEVLVAAVRLLGRRHPGVLPHRPQPAAVHRRVDPAGVGVLAGVPELGRRVEPLEVLGAVHGLQREAAHRHRVVARHLQVTSWAGG